MNELGAFKEWLQEHLDDLKDKAPAQKHEINDLYQEVTTAYETALNSTLVGNDEVLALTDQLTSIQADITRRMDQNDDITGIIGKITTGVGIATKIAGFFIKP
jgi:hypothetical protein